jgi:DNA-binding response OmpR family regulator
LINVSQNAGQSLLVAVSPGITTPDATQLLDMGIDYVSSAYQPDWLAAQLRAFLRRSGRERSAPATIELGNLLIDLSQRQVTKNGDDVALTPTEFSVLRVLAERPGTVLPSGEIMQQVLGVRLTDAEAQDLLKVHIHRLRQKLEPDSDEPRYIRTVRGHGYMYAFERRSKERMHPALAESSVSS